MRKKPNVVIVMPAYNAEKTLKKTVGDLPTSLVKKIILVDDGSHDNTIKVAQKLGLETYIHPQNRGYGANQKTCYTVAFKYSPDIVVMIHPDYQYDSSLTQKLIAPIIAGKYDIMLGSRMSNPKSALSGGMPLYKYLGNRFLTWLENLITGAGLSEYHTGFRAFHVSVLRQVPFHRFSDNFVFDQEILFSALRSGFTIGEIGVPTRYNTEASSINAPSSIKYRLATLLLSLRYLFSYFPLLNPIQLQSKIKKIPGNR